MQSVFEKFQFMIIKKNVSIRTIGVCDIELIYHGMPNRKVHRTCQLYLDYSDSFSLQIGDLFNRNQKLPLIHVQIQEMLTVEPIELLKTSASKILF